MQKAILDIIGSGVNGGMTNFGKQKNVRAIGSRVLAFY